MPETGQEPAASAPPQPAPVRDPVWTGWDVLGLTALAVVAIVFINLLALLWLTTLPAYQGKSVTEVARAVGEDARVAVPVQIAAYLLLIGAMYALVRWRYRRPFLEAVRWRWQTAQAHWLPYLGSGIVLAIGVQAASTLLPIPKDLPIERFFRDPVSAYILAAFGTLVAPAVEELFFRGFLYPVLERRLGMGAAVVLTAIPFALIHAPQLDSAWAPVLLLFVVGVVLTTVRAVSGSVSASFMVHAGYNFSLFAVAWVATGGFRQLEALGLFALFFSP